MNKRFQINKQSLLRLNSEAKISCQGKKASDYAEHDLNILLHELEVHRVELEMQNEELRNAQQLSHELTQKYTSLFDHAPMSYFSLNREAKILDLNILGASLLGDTREYLKNKNFRYFIKRDSLEEFNEFLENVFHQGIKQECELELLGHDQTSKYIYLKGIVSEDSSHCLATAVDITRRVLAERALKESEASLREMNETKNKFFSIISHDLRSPFTSIIGLSNLLINKVNVGDYADMAEYAQYIQVSSHRALELLTNLLEWSNTQSGRINFSPRDVDLDTLVMEAIRLSKDAAMQKSITVTKDLPINMIVRADKTMINTVIRNLLTNAIKFTHPGGEISISAEKQDGKVLIKVKDNGVGIKKQALEKLFRIEEGYSTMGTHDEKGTGLGLVLVKEFVMLHEGNIWVESEVGKGSTFLFTLPIS